MKKYIYLGLGGTLGAILRFFIKNIEINKYRGSFPLNTLLINLTGSFILAFILTVTYETWQLDKDIKLGITTGFLGAYTTFSTMCKETVILLNKGYYFLSISYVGFSMVLGLLSACLGIVLAKKVESKLVIIENNELETASDKDSEIEGES